MNFTQPSKFGHKEWLAFVISMLILSTDLAILLDIPFLRQILGFLFLTILPGLLILQILKLDELNLSEMSVLICGLSIFFLMFFGLLINNLALNLGYKAPLSTIPLLISFNVAFIILTIIGYRTNKEPFLSFPNLNLSSSEKAFLIVPILFPAFSVLGSHIMNTTNDNIILIMLLFLVPAYAIIIVVMRNQFPERIYPAIILLMSSSLLLMLSLRSNHIMGMDEHSEYRLYQLVFNAGYWSIIEKDNLLNACLSITLLPALYQSLLKMNGEYIFKILYALFFSLSPGIVYILSKKYIGNINAFLASLFFMSYPIFFWGELNFRTRTAIVFFALSLMVYFHNDIGKLNKRLLFIFFVASCIVSHYSTSIIFFFLLLLTWIGMRIVSWTVLRRRKSLAPPIISGLEANSQNSLQNGGMLMDNINDQGDLIPSSPQLLLNKGMPIAAVTLFFIALFVWYSIETNAPFTSGIRFMDATFLNLNQFFVLESSGLTHEDLSGGGIPQTIEMVCSRVSLTLIAVGILGTAKRYKEVISIENLEHSKEGFLQSKIDMEYFILTLGCSMIAACPVILPFIAKGYSLSRWFQQMFIIISMFFVVGSMMVEKSLRIKHYWLLLIVLIPYFMCSSGAMYWIFDIPKSVALNSEGDNYNYLFIHDQESYSARWLKANGILMSRGIYTDVTGDCRLISQASISPDFIDRYSLIDNDKKVSGGYIYLRYYNVVNSKLADRNYIGHDMAEYKDKFIEKSKIYNNNGSEIYE